MANDIPTRSSARRSTFDPLLVGIAERSFSQPPDEDGP